MKRRRIPAEHRIGGAAMHLPAQRLRQDQPPGIASAIDSLPRQRDAVAIGMGLDRGTEMKGEPDVELALPQDAVGDLDAAGDAVERHVTLVDRLARFLGVTVMPRL